MQHLECLPKITVLRIQDCCRNRKQRLKRENVDFFESRNFVWKLCSVAEDEMEEVAGLAEQLLSRRHIQVRTIRDAHYYRVLQKECRAEDGDLCWMLQDGRRAGLVAYTCDEAG